MSEIEILSKADAISVVKANRTAVDYFIFDEFEVHHCAIPAHSVQEWHRHSIIEEVIVVTRGCICVKWKEGETVKSRPVPEQCVLRVKKSLHTIANESDTDAEFLVFRMVPTGEEKRALIKNDKTVVSM